MSDKTNKQLFAILKNEIVPALGCTEPIAVAYSVAVAKKEIAKYCNEQVKSIEIYVDPFLFKNAMRVGIPGTNKKGALIAAALGYLMGKPVKKLEVIAGVEKKDINDALKMIKKGIINLHIKDDKKSLYIETLLTTENNKVKVVTEESHLNIVSIETEGHTKNNGQSEEKKSKKRINIKQIQQYSLTDLIDFVNDLPESDLKFLEKGIEMNKKIAQEGLKLKNSVGKTLIELKSDGVLCDNALLKAEIMCAAAAEARMSGCEFPVMSSTGSGNQGITIFLTVASFAENRGSSQVSLLRALALSNLIAIYIKSYLGSLSVLCGASVAAGAGAAGGIAYLMGGKEKEIFNSVINVMGSITGMICDGAKGGCAYKVCLSSGWAIKSALLAVRGVTIGYEDGILADNFQGLVKHLAYLNEHGMKAANKTILDIMVKSLDQDKKDVIC